LQKRPFLIIEASLDVSCVSSKLAKGCEGFSSLGYVSKKNCLNKNNYNEDKLKKSIKKFE
jgi:hypothetical protein